ncbi:MAG: c-type cytochrome, partial [Bryobacteraceae bacterium]
MRFILSAALALAFSCSVYAQPGKDLFAKRCAPCHGQNARGGEAVNLFKSRIVLQESPAPLMAVLKNGIPGTEMVPQNLPDKDARALVDYLRKLTLPALQPPAPGDAAAGRILFERHGCGECHMVGGKGGVLGPNLASVAFRNRLDEIREAILKPGANVPGRYRAVTVITASGANIKGLLKSEDNFSLQIMKLNGEFALLLRSEVRRIDIASASLMPSGFGEKLSADELRDL